MFQDNPLLAKLKHQLRSRIVHAEGIVKSTGKGFGFLEVDAQKSYFIPPAQMKKVMHGDRISAVIHSEQVGESAEPKILIEPFLTRFVGKVCKRDCHLSITPDHPLLKDAIPCWAGDGVFHNFKEGDWAVAEMRQHPLKGDHSFYAELTQFVTYDNDYFVPWCVTLARYNLEKKAPEDRETEIVDEGLDRLDLTMLDFVTIDHTCTEDMDDALYVTENSDGTLSLTVAIADPTARIAEGTDLDESAKVRAFSNYLPNFNIPMLPKKLSNDLCSLRPNEVRPALACQMTITSNGTIEKDIKFFAAIIKSKAKLTYTDVSDWLESTGNWRPKSEPIATQIRLLHRLCLRRLEWRATNALVFNNPPDYRFVLNKKGDVLDIVAEARRIAHRIVEESMIAANICAAHVLRDKLGFGIYNVHTGFNPANVAALSVLLKTHGIQIDADEMLTLSGFCKLRRELDTHSLTPLLVTRIRRFQSSVEISTKPGPHFGLGVEAYATWTSPIRKYGDMINHRLLKAIIKGESIACPKEETIIQMTVRRRLNRLAERDVGNWLYARFLKDKAGSNVLFSAEVIGMGRNGIRVRLIDNGAVAYIPASFLHPVRDEMTFNQKNGILQIKGEIVYKIMDLIIVTIAEVHMETRSIIARPTKN